MHLYGGFFQILLDTMKSATSVLESVKTSFSFIEDSMSTKTGAQHLMEELDMMSSTLNRFPQRFMEMLTGVLIILNQKYLFR
jgi:hypothetical protein